MVLFDSCHESNSEHSGLLAGSDGHDVVGQQALLQLSGSKTLQIPIGFIGKKLSDLRLHLMKPRGSQFVKLSKDERELITFTDTYSNDLSDEDILAPEGCIFLRVKNNNTESLSIGNYEAACLNMLEGRKLFIPGDLIGESIGDLKSRLATNTGVYLRPEDLSRIKIYIKGEAECLGDEYNNILLHSAIYIH